MDGRTWLTRRFGESRAHLRAVACRMPGPEAEADDVVQESLLRLSSAGTSGVHILRAWLTTVVARVCRDVRRFRTAGAGWNATGSIRLLPYGTAARRCGLGQRRLSTAAAVAGRRSWKPAALLTLVR